MQSLGLSDTDRVEVQKDKVELQKVIFLLLLVLQ